MAAGGRKVHGPVKRFRAVVRGRVQGVSFRYYTWMKAGGLGLAGYVRNLSSGAVEVVAEGPEKPLRRLLSWLHVGPPLARVSRVEVWWPSPGDEPLSGGLGGFEVRY